MKHAAVSLNSIRRNDTPLAPFDTTSALALAMNILAEVMRYRRTVSSCHACNDTRCQACFAPHLQKVLSAIAQGQPISFVLPAFPGKSPNLAKVFGPLPDGAERRALAFLDQLCKQIETLYAPGARMILCSDGRVFSDVVGMIEHNVTDYQCELDLIIEDLNLTNLSTFNLDQLSKGREFDEVRRQLMEDYGQPLDALKEKVRRGGCESEVTEDKEAHRMYCGITRFLFEDAIHPHQTKSRTAIQKLARANAYEVIRRSNAWSELIAERFPDAVRLSIHPQACGAKKLGISLLGGESWMTPWHGVVVDTADGPVLMKRWEAEELGGRLVFDQRGRPSHYKLVAHRPFAALTGERL